MTPLRVMVVDDEPLARAKVVDLLADEEDVSIVGEAADGPSAVELIRAEAPDLVFLDVQMPGLDGFQVVDEVGADALPAVVFVTAFDEHALRAFDVAAVDYLLKPFARERFKEALARGRGRVRERDSSARVEAMLDALDPPGPMERFVIRSTGRIQIVDATEVDWIEADGNYVRLHTAAGSYLARASLSGLEARLDTSRFLRIHRSRMVSLARVRELRPGDHGEFVLVLEDGTTLSSSRAFHDPIAEWLEAGCPTP